MSVMLRRTTDLLPLIKPYAAACPDFVVEQAARFAAIDLAERSRSWRHLVEIEITDDPVAPVLTGSIDGNTLDILFVVAPGDMPAPGPAPLAPIAAVHEFEFAEFDGQPLRPVQFTSVANAREGRPEYITQVSPGTISLVPFRPGKLSMSVFLKPVSETEFGTDPDRPLFDRFNVVPAHFITLHGATLAAGALARILSIPNEPWSNEQKGALYRAEFEAKLNGSFRSNMRGQQRAPIRTKYRDF